jgi:uncharacterized damage-inducible protein DinB
MNETKRIVDELAREHDGDPWHGPSLTQILQDVSPAQACARPIPGAHSIWELVLHVTAWKNEVRRRLGGAAAALPEEGDWPDVGEPSAQRWTEARARLQRAHESLLDAVRMFPEAKLDAPSNDGRDPDAGGGVSYYVLLHGLAQHDAYHAGQIRILTTRSG